MRLLTHNMLVCNVKVHSYHYADPDGASLAGFACELVEIQACADTAGREAGLRPLNFPLRIVPEMDGVVVAQTVFSKTFMLHILKSIDYLALCETTKELNHPDVPILPEQIPEDLTNEDELLKLIHRVIFDTNIVEGELVCNNCARSYPITHAVPNMLLEDDEM